MATFKDFGSFTKKLKSKVSEFSESVNSGLINIYGLDELTGFETGYLRSAFHVSDKPGAASSIRTGAERLAAANGTDKVDTSRLRKELKEIPKKTGIIYHYNEAFYSGIQELHRKTFRIALNNLKDISSRAASRLVKK
jgi:hypothetical protein